MKIAQHKTQILVLAASAAAYAFYVSGISTNPPGFYIDETLAAYNAYHLYQTGQGEFGHTLPLYFPVLQLPPPHNFLGWADPVQIYILAGLHFLFPPNYTLPRLLSATAMFIACLLLGRLGYRLSGSRAIGVAVGLTAILTPWLFETGRLAFGSSLYPCATAILLTAVYSASRKERWSPLNIAAIGLSLALTTYTYSIGRLLGPLLAFGLIVFVTGLPGLRNVLKAWVAYAITLIPLVIFHFRNPGALAGRFNMTVGVITPDKSYLDIATAFFKNYAANINPYTMLFTGDPNLRHHIMDASPVLAATFVLAVLGLAIVLIYHLREAWWRFVLFGLAASVVPASLTLDQFHMLRLIAFPIFFITLTIPALRWLFAAPGGQDSPDRTIAPKFQMLGSGLAATALLLTVLQAVAFQVKFAEEGPKRDVWFDDAYPRLLQKALASPSRPIYLFDGYWGQMYLHAYWYAAVHGIDQNNFVHVDFGKRPPPGSLVLSSEDKCTTCEMIEKDGLFLLYRENP